jgi:hypothetical protein
MQLFINEIWLIRRKKDDPRRIRNVFNDKDEAEDWLQLANHEDYEIITLSEYLDYLFTTPLKKLLGDTP